MKQNISTHTARVTTTRSSAPSAHSCYTAKHTISRSHHHSKRSSKRALMSACRAPQLVALKRSTKGQAQQIFIFILALLITAGIIVYGYTAIKDFADRQEEVATITLQTQLENEFEILLADFGTIKRPEIRVPEKYDFVCFGDGFLSKGAAADDMCSQASEAFSRVGCSAYQTDQSNVFFIPDGTQNFMIIDDKIDLLPAEGNILCIPVLRGRINLQLESKGDRILATAHS